MARRSLGDSAENTVPEEIKRVLSDLTGGDMGEIENQSPDFDYIWAATGHEGPGCVTYMQRLGYEIVNSENNSGERVPILSQPNSMEGALVRGDTVLMRIPIHLHNARVDYSKKLSRERMAISQRDFEEAVERADKNSGNKGIFIVPRQTGMENR